MAMSRFEDVVLILPCVNCWAVAARRTPSPTTEVLRFTAPCVYTSANSARESLKPTVFALARAADQRGRRRAAGGGARVLRGQGVLPGGRRRAIGVLAVPRETRETGRLRAETDLAHEHAAAVGDAEHHLRCGLGNLHGAG